MKRNAPFYWLFIAILLFKSVVSFGQTQDPVRFSVAMANPGNHTFHVAMEYKTGPHETSILKMPAWSPGYYQIMDFADGVVNFVAKDEEGKTLEFKKKGKNAWHIRKR